MTPGELQALVEALPVPALVMAQERILAANERLAQIARVQVEELLASPAAFLSCVSPADRPRILQRIASGDRAAKDEAPIDFTAIGRDGVPIPSRAHFAPFPAAGAEARLLVISDEGGRARTVDLIRGFLDVAVHAQRERALPDVFRVVRDRLHGLGLTSTILEIEGEGFRFAPFAEPITPAGAEMRERIPGWMPLRKAGVDLTGAAGLLIEDFPAFLANLVDLPPAHFAGRVPARAVAAAIRVSGTARFILSCSGADLDHAAAGAFGLLGRQLGAVLESALHIEELDRRNLELSLLFELGRELTGGLDPQRILQIAANNAAGALRCSCAYVFVPDSGRNLRVAARCDPDPELGLPVGETFSLELPSLTRLAFQTQKAHVSVDNLGDGRVSPEIADRFRCRSTLAIPLTAQGKTLGVLTFFQRSGRVFDDRDARLATLAAQLIASALQNAGLYAEARAQAEEMVLLNDVSRRMAGSLELVPLLQLGGETLQRAVGADLWFMMMPDEKAGGLRFAALQPQFEDMAEMVLPFASATAAATAFRERRVVQLLSSEFKSSESKALGKRFGHRATLAVPLIARDQCLGVAVALDMAHSRAFTPAQMERAAAVAGQLSLALLSAQLYEDLRQSYAKLERTQTELIDRERLAALGELSASIAHEVRNPLGVIFNSVGGLRRLLKPQGDVAMLLDIVGEEADRLNRMVGDLLDYSRPVRPALEPVPLRPILEEALASALQQVGRQVDAVKPRLRVAGSAATVRADARLLRQALINLFVNALQAMPKGGHLEVRVASAAGSAEIVINDTGPGIPPDLRGRIFQPFFTTKATGTGLGLAVVKRIVEGHGGTIGVGEASTGAEFRLTLPLAAGTR